MTTGFAHQALFIILWAGGSGASRYYCIYSILHNNPFPALLATKCKKNESDEKYHISTTTFAFSPGQMCLCTRTLRHFDIFETVYVL